MTVFTVNEARLRKYAAMHEEPAVEFEPRTTSVTIRINDGLTIISDDVNIDEHVDITLPGKRTFSGVKFDTNDMTIEGLKDPESRDYFDAFVDSILGMFEEQLCECGELMDCNCKKGLPN